jgi:hypothetical protein
MLQAVDRLHRDDTGSVTQQAEQNAIDRLKQVAGALRPELPSRDQGTPAPGAAGGDQPRRRPTQADLMMLAQLRLLRELQIDVFTRTSVFERTRGRAVDSLAAEQVQELQSLARSQAQLAELSVRLSQAIARNASADPDTPSDDGNVGETQKDSLDPSPGM